eukprot:scaffold15768_cov101-Isochrysis_galbana.AAC.1
MGGDLSKILCARFVQADRAWAWVRVGMNSSPSSTPRTLFSMSTRRGEADARMIAAARTAPRSMIAIGPTLGGRSIVCARLVPREHHHHLHPESIFSSW